jgi:uncharacterized membrane protein YraQ (UPF0718 family)
MDRILVSIILVTLGSYILLAMVRPQAAVDGLNVTAEMFVQALPWMLVSMFLAGLLSQFMHTEWIARWLGKEAGLSGIVLGALLGLCGTGSRWAVYPLAAGLIAAKASPGSVFSFVTSWQLISLTRLPAEIPFYGETFTLVRAVVSFLLAILGGILVDRLMN